MALPVFKIKLERQKHHKLLRSQTKRLKSNELGKNQSIFLQMTLSKVGSMWARGHEETIEEIQMANYQIF